MLTRTKVLGYIPDMKVLFLDDETWRHDGIDLMLLGVQHTVHHAYGTAEFSALLDSESPFDLVCFDHDLGPSTTGLDAARDFVARKHPLTRCIVHSWNPYGAKAIARVLRDGGHQVIVIPFSTAMKHLLDQL